MQRRTHAGLELAASRKVRAASEAMTDMSNNCILFHANPVIGGQSIGAPIKRS